jgi:DNA-binding transcriptional LysR family regulator
LKAARRKPGGLFRFAGGKGEFHMQNISVLSTHVADKVIDLNDLRIFAYVASLASFSSAADALQIHKSSVSRSIARLETMLETPLLQRTTRKVRLTQRGVVLQEGCIDMLSRVNETMGFGGGGNGRLQVQTSAAARPAGPKRSAGMQTMRRGQARLGASA